MEIQQHKTMFCYFWIVDSDMKIQQHKKNVLLFLNSWQFNGNSTTQRMFFFIFKYLTVTWKFNNTKRIFCYF